jgi:hypothetical protein
LLGLWLIIQAQTRAAAIAPRRSGYNVINIALHQPRERGAFTLLLQLNAGMLLLAAAADAKMRAARRLPLRAVAKTAFNLRAGVLFFIFDHDNFSLLLGNKPLINSALPW